MKKAGLLSLLEQMRAEQEGETSAEPEIVMMTLIDVLLDYINDPQIRAAVDEITF